MRQLHLPFSKRKDSYSNYDGKIISESPYIKILGNVTWSLVKNSYTALAQLEGMLVIISVNLSE